MIKNFFCGVFLAIQRSEAYCCAVEMRFSPRYVFAVVFTVVLGPSAGFAVRPFITDDARVTSKHTFLTEGSLRLDENRFQNLMLFAFGINDNLEWTVGFTNGFLRHGEEGHYAIYGPVVQLKGLFINQTALIPAIAGAVGVSSPWCVGNDDFAPSEWSEFGYIAISRAFSSHPERFIVHVNFGATIAHEQNQGTKNELMWGAGLQFVIIPDILFGMAEIVSGDPYGISSDIVYQVGLRIFISEQLQIDASYGARASFEWGVAWFAGCGLRYCTEALW
ncbi:MAG: hypothetical protein N2316_00140 [Spirochaetes bacterium]|nr:hypothetical protein [Spirochaetota bacterium]